MIQIPNICESYPLINTHILFSNGCRKATITIKLIFKNSVKSQTPFVQKYINDIKRKQTCFHNMQVVHISFYLFIGLFYNEFALIKMNESSEINEKILTNVEPYFLRQTFFRSFPQYKFHFGVSEPIFYFTVYLKTHRNLEDKTMHMMQ